MSKKQTASGGRAVNETGSQQTQTGSFQVFAGTLKPKSMLASQALKTPKEFPLIPLLIGSAFVIAVIIVVVAAVSLQNTKNEVQQKAAMAAQLQETQGRIEKLWKNEMLGVYSGLVARAETNFSRLDDMDSRLKKHESGDGVPELMKLVEHYRLQAVDLTNRLEKSQAFGERILKGVAAAGSPGAAQDQLNQMGRLEGSLGDFRSFAGRFSRSLDELEARIKRHIRNLPPPPKPETKEEPDSGTDEKK